MARKKKNDELNRQQILANADSIANQLGLTLDMSVKECAAKILTSADKVMDDICIKSDSIKIDAYKEFEELMADTVLTTKPFFFELVDIRRKAMYGELDTDKLQSKNAELDEGTEWTAKHNEMRKQLIGAFVNNNGEFSKVLTSAVEADSTVEITEDSFIDWPEDVIVLVDDCAKIRQFINTVLWPKIQMHADAFSVYCEAEAWEFSFILQMWHYRNGGYPSKGSKPKMWEIIDKFQYALRQCRKYGLDFADGYLDRFGLEVNITKEQPSDSAYIWDL